MKVLMCGDRNWTNREVVASWLAKLQDWGYDTVIEGEARGADTMVREEAGRIGMTVLRFYAEWHRYGRAAGPIRNRRMLLEDPDFVVAFHSDLSASRGTRGMVESARRAGIRVEVVSD